MEKLNRTGPKEAPFSTSLLNISCELLITALNIFSKKLQTVKKADNSSTFPGTFSLCASLPEGKIHSVLIISLHWKCMGGGTI